MCVILYNRFVLSFYSHIMSLLHLFSFLTLAKYQSTIYFDCLVIAATLCARSVTVCHHLQCVGLFNNQVVKYCHA